MARSGEPLEHILLQCDPVLRQAHVKQSQPILQRLQSEAAKNEYDAEDAEAPFGKIVSIVLDVWIHRYSDTRDKTGHQPDPKRERPHVVNSVHESAADQRGSGVADGSNDGPPELASSKTRSAHGRVIRSRPPAAPVSEHLAEGDENGK